MRKLLLWVVTITVMHNSYGQKTPGYPDTGKPATPAGITEKVKGTRKAEGLFTIYQDTLTGSVKLYIRKDQLGKEFIYQFFSVSGPTSLWLNQGVPGATWIFNIQRSFDRLEFTRLNTSFWYDTSSPLSKTAATDKPEAVFAAVKITGEDVAGYLIDADGIFISEKMEQIKKASSGATDPSTLSLGQLNPDKSKVSSIRSFTGNTDVIVDLAFDNPSSISTHPDITDSRYVRLRMQYSFIEMPVNDYRPRFDDPRIGYFSENIDNMTSTSPTPYRDPIHRWYLKKKDPGAALSEPVEPIVYWVENTTPVELRPIVLEAGRKWNQAFEKAGFKNAIVMKMMPDDATWSPDDIHYNVIRWTANPNPSFGAYGPSFVNPRTGQILGADISIEWRATFPPIQNLAELYEGETIPQPDALPNRSSNCLAAALAASQLSTGAVFLEINGGDSNALKTLQKQFFTRLIMHEMGHTLGLSHNMMASYMLSPAEVNNTLITDSIGLTGSVMEYPAINLASDKSKQGNYFTAKTGPYDHWAIEYGYSEFPPDREEEELKKILSRSTEPALAFGNDGDDMRSPGKGMDPRINVYDLTNDPIAYAVERFKLVNKMIPGLLNKHPEKGYTYAELKNRYSSLQTERINMIAAVSRYIGGIYIDRSFPEQHSATKPFTPVPLAVQKRAIKVLSKYAFAPDAFAADSALFPYLQTQRRGFSQPMDGEDFRIAANFRRIQLTGLSHILHPATLQRITNSSLYGNQYSVTEMLNDLQKGIFNADISGNVSPVRQYLQAYLVKSLINITTEKDNDAIAKAAAIHTLRRIRALLANAGAGDEGTKAHRSALVLTISKALNQN